MDSGRLQSILTEIRGTPDARSRNSLVDQALIALAQVERETYAARAAAVRVLNKGVECDADTLRVVKGWANE